MIVDGGESSISAAEACDLADPRLYQSGEPHHFWRQLRHHDGLYWHPERSRPGFWCATRYADVTAVWRDSRTFSCEFGMTLDTAGPHRDPAARKMLELTDPPRHARLRRLVTGAFLPSSVHDLRRDVRGLVEGLVARIPANQEVDFMAAVADRLPVAVNALLLGLSPEEASWVAARTSDVFLSHEAASGPDTVRTHRVAQAAMVANLDLLKFFERRFRRQEQPSTAGLMRTLHESSIAGTRLSVAELAANALNLVVGGNESTRSALANCLLTLGERPPAWKQLRDRPSQIDSVIEECLRLRPPARHITRTATCEAVVAGTRLSPGDCVALWIPSANRDEQQFESPDAFDPGRSPNSHLTFATGAHTCIGSGVARLQLHTVLEALLERFQGLRLLAAPRLLASNFMSRPISLSLEFLCRAG